MKLQTDELLNIKKELEYLKSQMRQKENYAQELECRINKY